jgi:hypothetical protein
MGDVVNFLTDEESAWREFELGLRAALSNDPLLMEWICKDIRPRFHAIIAASSIKLLPPDNSCSSIVAKAVQAIAEEMAHACLLELIYIEYELYFALGTPPPPSLDVKEKISAEILKYIRPAKSL